MENQNIARLMEEGAAFFPAEKAGRRPVWYSNPAWTGVALADLAPGADTKESFSSHLVGVCKGREVPDHLREGQWEWNAILDGHEKMFRDGKEVPFKPGNAFTTPPGGQARRRRR